MLDCGRTAHYNHQTLRNTSFNTTIKGAPQALTRRLFRMPDYRLQASTVSVPLVAVAWDPSYLTEHINDRKRLKPLIAALHGYEDGMVLTHVCCFFFLALQPIVVVFSQPGSGL
jgi:hypothetical protein